VRSGSARSGADQDQVCLVWLATGTEGFGILESARVQIGALVAAGWHVVMVAVADGAIVEVAREAGAAVEVLGQAAPKRLPDAGIAVRLIAATSWVGQLYTGARMAAAVRRSGQRHLSVVHVRPPSLLVAAAVAGRLSGRSVVWQIPNFTSATGRDVRLRQFGYKALLAAGGIRPLANSHATAAGFAFLGVDVPVLYVPIDEVRFSGDPIVEAPLGQVRFLSLGRVARSKGQLEILDGFEQFVLSGGDGSLTFVGLDDGDDSSRLREAVGRSPAADCVRLVTRVDDPAPHISETHVLISGQREFEPFGQVAAQALRMGRPVLALGAGGPREMVEFSGGGWWADFSPSAIARAMGVIHDDRQGIVEHSTAAHRFGQRRFAPEAFVGAYSQHFMGPTAASSLKAVAHRWYRRLRLDRIRLAWDRRRLRHAGGIVVNEAGIRMHLDPGDSRAVGLFRHRGSLDHRAIGVWQRLSDGFGPDVVLDIGANYGEVALSTVYPSCRAIYLVEANPSIQALLQRTIDGLPHGWPSVSLIRAAASDTEGTAQLYMGSTSGLSSLRTSGDPGRSVVVPTVRLDGRVALDVGDRLLFKIDVEGHEIEVLSGMEALLADRQFIGLVEVMHLSNDALRWLDERFTVVSIGRDKTLFENISPLHELSEFERRMLSKDALLVPKGDTLMELLA
jgi:FkbM family methyltransferase